MTTQDVRVELTRDEFLTLYRVLNEVCVSLDQIYSREAGGSTKEASEWLLSYFSALGDGAAARLDEARGVVLEAAYRSIQEDDLEAVGAEISYWADRHPNL
jgi:hypothetical protein